MNSFWSWNMLSRLILVLTLLLFRREDSLLLAVGSSVYPLASGLRADAVISPIFGRFCFYLGRSLPLRSSTIRECCARGEASLFWSMSRSWSWTCYYSGLKVVSETYLITGFTFLMRIEVLVNWLVLTSGILGRESYCSSSFRFFLLRWAAKAYIFIYQNLLITNLIVSLKLSLFHSHIISGTIPNSKAYINLKVP